MAENNAASVLSALMKRLVKMFCCGVSPPKAGPIRFLKSGSQ
jgi:hypothetical protein